ncbi:hypothetical protein [Psychroflexus sediminis]|uniref:Uncharacterized protein n=1 Tax=Psychroflexus sediminis TaxID=470826 RepID=A0A1G7TZK7_9FLAO|nr:hypothetical protein [Psychroflexus sediminis]SDG40703.1 hypothetical protein SAMN04488027_101159 [Psychroflexus sediminis]
MKKGLYFICALLLCFQFTLAQVGIGTDTPSTSSILDVESTTAGVLFPRMTTGQRTAITSPANGLTVFDTDIQAYLFYNAIEATWERLHSSRLERENYILVKNQSDFPAATAGSIVLDENTFYEINGNIALDAPIDLNGAYIAGLDANEDVLSRVSGNVFEGSGGSIRNITITGAGSAFSISSGTSFLVQNTIIANMTKVGTVSNLSFVFFSNVQYINNSDGVVYSDILNLSLNNQAWQGDNTGTYEKFEGVFELIQKESGYSIANGTAISIDVSANPTVHGGVIIGTAFSGTSLNYVERYTTGVSADLNFTKEWFVQAPGIQNEYDDIASGNIFYNGELDTGYSIISAEVNVPFKLTGGATTANLHRFTSDANNRLRYEGEESATFSVNASLSVRGSNNQGVFFSFFIRRNGTETLNRTNSIFYVTTTTNVSTVAINGTVTLEPDDYIEIWGQKLTGSGTSSLIIFSQTLNIH